MRHATHGIQFHLGDEWPTLPPQPHGHLRPEVVHPTSHANGRPITQRPQVIRPTSRPITLRPTSLPVLMSKGPQWPRGSPITHMPRPQVVFTASAHVGGFPHRSVWGDV